MVSFARKNLACLIWNHNSFVSKSHVWFSICPQFFSTSTDTHLYDTLLHKHHFSPQVASLVVSNLTRFRSPEKADSILSFLEDSGFSTTSLEKIVKYRPRILTASVEDDIKCKIKIFQDLGLSAEDIAKIISNNSVILHLSAKNNIIPSLSMLKRLVGSDDNVAQLLRKTAWFLTVDLGKTLMPNVEFFRGFGIPMKRILMFLYMYPRFFLIKPDMMRKSVHKVKELGVSQSSNLFVYAIQVIATIREETWEIKLQCFRDLGFSESDMLKMFRKAPQVFKTSTEKIKMVVGLLLATGKFDVSSIVTNPPSLGCSVEKRLKPRLQNLETLKSRNLIKKWPNLGTIYTLSDDKFFEKFVRPYANELGRAKSNIKVKRVTKLRSA